MMAPQRNLGQLTFDRHEHPWAHWLSPREVHSFAAKLPQPLIGSLEIQRVCRHRTRAAARTCPDHDLATIPAAKPHLELPLRASLTDRQQSDWYPWMRPDTWLAPRWMVVVVVSVVIAMPSAMS
ncbi:hypothetical protein LO763_22625 [Glycomyces sp. A-F 0318]|uniref:hypothetical protein n=1 Tax=Glycomyces amatae TaxID=2881355 RepID=UPI001E52A844|nr:hypothetical protein [Glycomyces amatae]MCD0446415.1 hypothetical protein [Glycomyces amatae]